MVKVQKLMPLKKAGAKTLKSFMSHGRAFVLSCEGVGPVAIVRHTVK